MLQTNVIPSGFWANCCWQMDKQPAGTWRSRADPKSDFGLGVACEAGWKLRSWGGGKGRMGVFGQEREGLQKTELEGRKLRVWKNRRVRSPSPGILSHSNLVCLPDPLPQNKSQQFAFVDLSPFVIANPGGPYPAAKTDGSIECVKTFDIYNNATKWVQLLSLLFRRGNWGTREAKGLLAQGHTAIK